MRYFVFLLLSTSILSSCQPKDKMMSAIEQLHEEGIISEVFVDSLEKEFKVKGEISRLSIVEAVLRSSPTYAWSSSPPYRNYISSSWHVAPEYVEQTLAQNQKNLAFLKSTNFFEDDEITLLESLAKEPEELNYDYAFWKIAQMVYRKELASPKSLKNFSAHLAKHGIATQKMLEEVNKAIDQGTIKNQYEVLSESNNGLVHSPENIPIDSAKEVLMQLWLWNLKKNLNVFIK